MPAVTPSVTSGEDILAMDLNGLTLRRHPFTSVATGDTWASPYASVVYVGTGNVSGAAVAATFLAGTFVFVTGGTANFDLLVWTTL